MQAIRHPRDQRNFQDSFVNETPFLSAIFLTALHVLIQFALVARALLRPHRDPASRIAWVVVIVSLPVLGILSYLLFGEVNIGRRRVQRMRAVLARMPALPDAVADDVAAASLLKGMTAELLVRRAFRVEPGMTVLLHAAAGGVGLIACQWMASLGVTVIGTVGSDEKAELARAHGCAHAIVYTREDFVARTRELTDGAGVPVVYDSVGRATFDGSLRCLARRGMLVGFGNASGKPDPFDMGRLAQHGSLYLTRPTLFDYVATRAELLASAQSLFEVMRSGAVKVPVRQRWPLAEAAEAHRRLEARMTQGSSVLVP